MKPKNFEGAVPFNKPKNWDDERDGVCGALPVFVEGPRHISWWTLSDEERKAIVNGADVWLTCYGSQPPVALLILDCEERPRWWSKFLNWFTRHE